MGQKYMKHLFQILNKRSVIQKRKETKWVLEAHYWPWYREEELEEIKAVSVSWENWVHSLGRLRGLEFGGTHTGEERANQGKVQKSAHVPLGLLPNTKWAYIERNFTNLGNYWRAVSWTFPRNYTEWEVFYPARDIIEPLENSVEIPEGHDLVEEVALKERLL